MSEKIIAYKAMDKNMQCRGKQYEVGKTYHEDKADCCHAGMHACENPLDVLHYYPLSDGIRIFKVECGGDISREDGKDTKLACTELTVEAEIKIADMVKLGVKAVMDRVNKNMKGTKNKASGNWSTGAASGYKSTGAASGNWSTGAASGNWSTGAASGYKSTGAASGNWSTGAASGYCCRAEAFGKDSIAVANGAHSKARGAMGCYLVLTEYDDDGGMIRAKMAKVDGSVIKENVWYTLKNGEFVGSEA
jgi:hypothetical protein